MKVAVQLFGPLAEAAGKGRLEVEVSEPTVEGVLARLTDLTIDSNVKFAVNTDYAERSAAVRELLTRAALIEQLPSGFIRSRRSVAVSPPLFQTALFRPQ